MNSFVQKVARHPIALTVAASAIINITNWVLALRLFPHQAPAVILHYSVGNGVDFVGEGDWILRIPAIGSSILILNVLVAYGLRRASIRAVWILTAALPILEVALLAAFVLLLRVN
ncbi:MAG: hypothetical protein WD200_04565 [Candidatus Andersenbacteria bacterium]